MIINSVVASQNSEPAAELNRFSKKNNRHAGGKTYRVHPVKGFFWANSYSS